MNQNLSSIRFRALIRFVQVAGLIMVMTLCAGNALSARTVWAHPLLQGDGDGLQVSGAKLELSATPGQVYVHNMQIGIGLKSPPVDIQITANGFGEDKDGQFLPLSDQQDISPYSGRTLITGIDNTRFRLQPGQTVPVAVTITVPNDIGTHARYATVYIDSQVMSVGTAVGQKLGIIVPIVITPLDAQKTLTGNVSELEVGALEVGEPITAAITVQNTGNYHYKVRGNMMITDANGQAVATVPLDLTGTSIIPTFSQRLQMSYAALDRPNGLQPGRYTLAAEVVREDGSLVGTRQTTFNVKAPLQICPGIDNSNVIVQQFNNQEPSEIDVRASAQMVIGFEGTGKVTGQVAICPYPQEPEGGPRFSAGLGEGGLGKPSLSFVMVRIDGFRQGTAHVRFHYQENALNQLNPNSLFIAYRDQKTWRKLDNLVIQTGAELVQGDLALGALADNPVLALGGDGYQNQTKPQVVQRKGASKTEIGVETTAAGWLPVGLAVAVVVVIIVGSVLFVWMRRR